MKNTILLKAACLFLLFSLSAFAQNSSVELSSVEAWPHAELEIKNFQFNQQQGYTIEIDNNECGVADSEYLSKPISYSSNNYKEAKGGFSEANGVYKFTTPFSIEDLGTKWFRWRVKDNNGFVSQWMCYSWGDYCKSFLNPDGTCK